MVLLIYSWFLNLLFYLDLDLDLDLSCQSYFLLIAHLLENKILDLVSMFAHNLLQEYMIS